MKFKPLSMHTYLFAVSGGKGAVAVLGESHLHGDVKRQTILIFCKPLGDADAGMNRLIRAGPQQGTVAGKQIGFPLRQINNGSTRCSCPTMFPHISQPLSCTWYPNTSPEPGIFFMENRGKHKQKRQQNIRARDSITV